MAYKTLPLDIARYNAAAGALIARGDQYVWGGKARTLREFPPHWLDMLHGQAPCGGGDCSGGQRVLIHYATATPGLVPLDGLDIGDGSYNQGEFLRDYGCKLTLAEYTGLEDGHLRMCVHHPDELDPTGHIWGVRNKVTTEFYGGHGIGHRSFDARLRSGHRLVDLATLTFVVT